MVVAHTIVVSVYLLLREGTCYDESRYDRQDARQEEREKKRAVTALERLGDEITLSPVTSTAPVPCVSVG